MAIKIGEYMEEHGVNMIRECVPTSLEQAGEGIKVLVENKKKWIILNVLSSYLVE